MRGCLTKRLLELEEAWNEEAGVDAMVNPVNICSFVAILREKSVEMLQNLMDRIQQDGDHFSKLLRKKTIFLIHPNLFSNVNSKIFFSKFSKFCSKKIKFSKPLPFPCRTKS